MVIPFSCIWTSQLQSPMYMRFQWQLHPASLFPWLTPKTKRWCLVLTLHPPTLNKTRKLPPSTWPAFHLSHLPKIINLQPSQPHHPPTFLTFPTSPPSLLSHFPKLTTLPSTIKALQTLPSAIKHSKDNIRPSLVFLEELHNIWIEKQIHIPPSQEKISDHWIWALIC